jgi:predicted RNA-binding Zn ribbon-like protein
VSPRYDVPNAAPAPLREVQLFVNSIDEENGVEWLPGWLAEHGAEGELERARTLRQSLRALALANNALPLADGAVEAFNAAASRIRLGLDDGGRVRMEPDDGDALDRIVAVTLGAMLDGSWSRLKACRHCCWSFYDKSPNRSGTWCSMQLCGNRAKTRSYRRRRKTSL